MGEFVAFALRRWLRDEFDPIFKTGIDLTEETANYLDGHGRNESSQLSGSDRATYHKQSMRMTLALMQLTSWLIAMRAVKEHEITEAEFRKERSSIKNLMALSVDTMANAPEVFRDLAYRVNALISQLALVEEKYLKEPDDSVKQRTG